MKKLICLVICLSLLLPIPVYGENAEAVDISETTTVSGNGYTGFRFLTDKNLKTYHTSDSTAEIILENGEGIGGVYVLMNFEYGEIILQDNVTGEKKTVNGSYLHLFADVKALFGRTLTSLTLRFENGAVSLSEIYVYTEGETPSTVQKWNAPHEGGADLVLFATHGDDDQLFFAGLLPLFAGEKQLRVQVVYLTDHRNLTNARTHEMLNGLWAVGVDAYPVFGDFADFRIDDLQASYDYYASVGTTEKMLQSFVVEQIRRFKPMVAVGHDVNGEYGHGMHMVYTDLLIKALDIAPDATQFAESAEKYGTWTVPKTYLHLYEKNKVVIDYDTPLESFNGMTAFEVTQKLGYPCHESQQFTWFTDWINGSNGQITKASQIKTYNPCEFGLYRSEVGADANGNDFFENVKTYAVQEEEARAEEEKRKEEETKQETKQTETKCEPETEAENEKVNEERKFPEITAPLVAGVAVVLLAVLIGGVSAVGATVSRKRKRKNRYQKFMNKK